MPEPISPDLAPIISMYREAYDRHGLSPASVLMPKGRQDVRFGSLCRYMKRADFSVLDYGSGLGDLLSYMNTNFERFRYQGVEIVEEFVAASRHRFPGATFDRLQSYRELSGHYDYVVVAGVFNVLYFDGEEKHKAYVFEALAHLFSLCKGHLAVNFMTDRVDFRQPRAYHQNPAELCDFATQTLSPRWVLDQSYMPYEFTLVVFRSATIKRPDNVYLPES